MASRAASAWGALPADVWRLVIAALSASYPALLRARMINRTFAAAVADHCARRSCLGAFVSGAPFRTISIATAHVGFDPVRFSFVGGNAKTVRLVWREWISSAFPPVDDVVFYARTYCLADVRNSLIPVPEPRDLEDSDRPEDRPPQVCDSAGNAIAAPTDGAAVTLVGSGRQLALPPGSDPERRFVLDVNVSADGVVGVLMLADVECLLVLY